MLSIVRSKFSLSSLYFFVMLCCPAVGFIYHSYMVTNCPGECELPSWKVGITRILAETHIPLLEPPQSHKAYWYSSGIHIWVSLLCWGGHRFACWHAPAGSTWYWRSLAGETWAVARDRASIRSSGLRVQSQTWACL